MHFLPWNIRNQYCCCHTNSVHFSNFIIFPSNITTQLGRHICEGINHLMQMWTQGRLTYLLLQQWHYKGDWQLHQHMPSRELQKGRQRDTCKWRQLVLNEWHIHWHIYAFWNITIDTIATYAGVRLGWLCSIYFWMFWSLSCMLLNAVCQPSSLILTSGLADVIFSTHLKWFLPLFRDWLSSTGVAYKQNDSTY